MGDSESEDSDAEGGLGNVSRVVMRPPGHSGKAKKGHLCFDASFETGNLGKVDLISDFEYDLFIRPDTCNPYHRMWFNFIVDNIKLDQRVLFNIVNISKHKNHFCDGMTPIVKSTSRKKWNRMPPHQVYYYRSPYHNDNYVLTLAFCFDKEEEAYQFSYSYPYSYTRCQAYLELIERKTLPHFKRELLGNSLQKRRVDIVTITHPSNMELRSKIRMVVICSRVHPGDSPSSYVCQGIIDFLISNHPVAEKLRNNVVFKIIPMINPDGVVLGNFRSNLLGADFNRNWNRISQWMHPPLHAINNTINKLNAHKNVELDFVIDIHAHCSLCGVFVHGNTYEDVYRHERHTLFPKLLSQNIDGYEPNYCMFNRDPKQKGSCRRFFSNLRETVNCYSIFTSFYGYTRKSNKTFIHFNEELYHRVGRNIVRSFSDYYRYVGVLPAKPKSTKSTTTTTTKSARKKPSKKSKHRAKVRTHSKIKRRKFKKLRRRYHHHRSKKIKQALRVITSVELKSKLDLKKGFIDFSNIEFPKPSIDNQKRMITIRRKLLSRFRNVKCAEEQESSNSLSRKDDNSASKTESSIKIITIGEGYLDKLRV